MDTLPTGPDEVGRMVNQIIAHYDAPAYVRRACRVQGSLDSLLGRCRQQREEWLHMVRTRLGLLHALAGDWARLRPLLLDAEQLPVLEELQTILQPRLRLQIEPASSVRTLRRALEELCASIRRFNCRWEEYLRKVDVSEVNELREGYNRYYLLEKECALHSPSLARKGFTRLKPLTLDELTQLLPPLPVPRPMA